MDTKQEAKDVDTSRRDFLKKAGKFAVYAPPAMLVLSSPSFKAIAQSSGSGGQAPPAFDIWEWLKKLLGG